MLHFEKSPFLLAHILNSNPTSTKMLVLKWYQSELLARTWWTKLAHLLVHIPSPGLSLSWQPCAGFWMWLWYPSDADRHWASFVSIQLHFYEDFLKGWEINKLRHLLGWKRPLKKSGPTSHYKQSKLEAGCSHYDPFIQFITHSLGSSITGPAQGKVHNAHCFSPTGQANHFIREGNQVVQTPFVGISILVIPNNNFPVFHLVWHGFQEELFHSYPKLTSTGIDSISRESLYWMNLEDELPSLIYKDLSFRGPAAFSAFGRICCLNKKSVLVSKLACSVSA